MESLTAIHRAGADIILTYYTRAAARALRTGLAGGTRVHASSGVVGIYSAGATIMIWSRAALSAGSSDSPEG